MLWKDNKYITLVSSFIGELPLKDVERFDRKLKKKISVPCPNIITEYNRHMGGLDFLDSLIGRYKIELRTKKVVSEFFVISWI